MDDILAVAGSATFVRWFEASLAQQPAGPSHGEILGGDHVRAEHRWHGYRARAGSVRVRQRAVGFSATARNRRPSPGVPGRYRRSRNPIGDCPMALWVSEFAPGATAIPDPPDGYATLWGMRKHRHNRTCFHRLGRAGLDIGIPTRGALDRQALLIVVSRVRYSRRVCNRCESDAPRCLRASFSPWRVAAEAVSRVLRHTLYPSPSPRLRRFGMRPVLSPDAIQAHFVHRRRSTTAPPS